MSTSNDFGFLPESPTQSLAENSGIFEVNDVVELLQAGQFALGDSYQLIETQTVTSATATVDFTNLGTFKTHYLVLSNNENDANDIVSIRFGSGGTFKTSRYSSSFRYGGSNSLEGDDRSQTETAINRVLQHSYSGGVANGYFYIYHAVSATETNVTGQSFGRNSTPSTTSYFHFGGWEQNEAVAYDTIRLFCEGGNNIISLTASLYGVT